MGTYHGAKVWPRLAAALALPGLLAFAAGPAAAYTIEFCNDYANRVVQEATGTELSYAMRTTPADPGLSALTGSGTSSDNGSLSSVLRELSEPQEQKTLWQRTFDHCMGVTR